MSTYFMSGLPSSLPLQTTGQVGVEFLGRRSCGRRERTHHEHGGAGERRKVLPDQVTEAAFHAIADYGVAHGAAHHEPHAGRLVAVGGPQVRDQGARRGSPPMPARPSERLRIGEALRRGYHCRADGVHRPGRGARLRRRGSCGPCGGGWRGSPGPHGCACAGGNRAPCAGGGCSAGTYACSRLFLRSTESAPVTRAIGTCASSAGTAHPRITTPMDMRHPSTPGDRPTVRGRARQGQTRGDQARNQLPRPVENRLPAHSSRG